MIAWLEDHPRIYFWLGIGLFLLAAGVTVAGSLVIRTVIS